MIPIIVVGDLILDVFEHVETIGLTQESRTALKAKRLVESKYPGGAANVAINCRLLGQQSILFAAADNDEAVTLVRRNGITLCGMNTITGHTPVKRRTFVGEQMILRVDDEVTLAGDDQPWFISEIGQSLASAPVSVLVAVDYGKGTLADADVVMALRRQAHTNEVRAFVVDPGPDPNWKRFSSPRTIFKVNLRQAEAFYQFGLQRRADVIRVTGQHDGYRAAAGRVGYNLKAAGVEFAAVIVTLGEDGVMVCVDDAIHGHDDGSFCERAAHYVGDGGEARNVCGAGDLFMAHVAAEMASCADPMSVRSILVAAGKAEAATRRRVCSQMASSGPLRHQ
jgi:bifunctional ADP-heptose synthase (sugar kinase/adenylyltransferase)